MPTLFLVIDLTTFLELLFPQIAFANHGQEISLTLYSAEFMPLTTTQGNQVKVLVNYTTQEPTIVGQILNAVMKVYTVNGSLIRTSSFPNGFTANSSGTEQLATTIRDNATQNVLVVIQFTDVAKTVPLSNTLEANVNLTQS